MSLAARRPGGAGAPVVAGVVGTLTGFFGSFAVVLTGLTAARATPEQAASGLLTLCVLQGVLSIALSWRLRIPLCVAWSTPGAALLVAAHRATGSFTAAIGAFAFCGVLLTLTGAFPAVARLIDRIPVAVTGALLAGILLPFCLAPVTAAMRTPALGLPLIAVWLVLTRFAPRWAAAVTILVAVVLTITTGGGAPIVAPSIVPLAPTLDPVLVISLGLPLYVVTMAGQNLPGLAVLRSAGYPPPTRLALMSTGIATVVAAPFGGHALNLAAITGAIMVGPESSPDPRRRWIAGVTSGALYLVLALGAGSAAALVGTAPPVLIEAGAGLALLGAFIGGLTTAVQSPGTRVPAAITFLVVASGATVGGIGSAFWGLIAGGAALLVLRRRPRRLPES